ncbi:hypothetical protein like AT4G10720 [Hibiscus trionum]|uniref:PGG domain-containing protein n=1 Tax=Hibiscus trionum TaxID=183268 RepID=A0A9W7HK98_HIBTR|nr:hypothetical protein like AT4G10720 [Hibiscus trionum]
MEMNPRLEPAAETGDIDALHVLIGEDPYILEGIEQIPFVQTPLHIAANEGHISFALEMINLKPSFAKKLNRDGFSPMHLALINGNTKLVLRLLATDKDLVRVKGWKGMTPFHHAATTGNSKLLFEFLEVCPECIEDVTVRDETALHLALKNDHVEAFKLLFGWLQRSRQAHANSVFAFENKMVNWKDSDDNTVFHIAALREQREALKLLLDSPILLHVQAMNSEGLTALEIIKKVERRDTNIDMIDEDDTKINRLKQKVFPFEKLRVAASRSHNCMSVDMINTMLVVTALVITAVYQSSLSPPGGVWQGDISDSIAATTPASNINPTNHYYPDNGYFNDTYTYILYGKESKKAGTTIMSPIAFGGFWIFNFITFLLTIVLTGFLLSSFHLFLIPLIPLYLLLISYFFSMMILSPSAVWSYINFWLMWLFEFLPLTLYLVWLFKSIATLQLAVVERKYRAQLRQVLGMGKLDIGSIVFFLHKRW